MLVVVNIKSVGVVEGGVYIGRRMVWDGKVLESSVLGNQFKIGRDGDRDEVIEKYRVWLWDQIKMKGVVYEKLLEIVERDRKGEKVVLSCWCKPEPCHGDVVRKAVSWLKNREGGVK